MLNSLLRCDLVGGTAVLSHDSLGLRTAAPPAVWVAVATPSSAGARHTVLTINNVPMHQTSPCDDSSLSVGWVGWHEICCAAWRCSTLRRPAAVYTVRAMRRRRRRRRVSSRPGRCCGGLPQAGRSDRPCRECAARLTATPGIATAPPCPSAVPRSCARGSLPRRAARLSPWRRGVGRGTMMATPDIIQ